jgi:hypothetical protein
MCIVIASLVLGCFGDIDEGVAMCLSQGWSTSVHLGFKWVVGKKDIFYVVSHILGILEILEFVLFVQMR